MPKSKTNKQTFILFFSTKKKIFPRLLFFLPLVGKYQFFAFLQEGHIWGITKNAFLYASGVLISSIIVSLGFMYHGTKRLLIRSEFKDFLNIFNKYLECHFLICFVYLKVKKLLKFCYSIYISRGQSGGLNNWVLF